MALIEKGTKAPDFTLKNQSKEDVSLRDFVGKKVLISFHPLAFTPVCTDQMRELERRYDEFEAKGVVPLGVSVDPAPAKTVWAKGLILDKLNILTDFNPLGEMSKAYGNFVDKEGFSGRANVLIDEDGQVIWSKQYRLSELPDVDEVLEQL